jgi:cobalt-zinc-cadmium efflux system outer membrane protein
MTLSRPLLAGLATLTWTLSAQSDPPRPADTEVRPLLEEALRANPEVASIREAVAAARARVSPAGALPDPTATLSYQYGGKSLGNDDDTWIGVSLEQPLPLASKRRLQEAIASKSADELALAMKRLDLNLEYEIRKAYTDLLLARETIALIAAQERTWSEIEAATRARYSAGMGEQQDVLRAQAERTRLVPMRLHEEGNEEGALASVNRLLGRPAGTPLPTPRRLAELAIPGGGPPLPPRDEVLRAAEEASPELAASSLALERAGLSSDLARRMLRPDFVASSSYMNRGALPSMFSVGVGVLLPVFSKVKQRRGVVEAESLAREETAAREALKLSLRVSIERDYAEWKAAVLEAAPYASGVLVQDRLAVDAARASYETGKSPFVSMLEAINTLFIDARAYVERLAHVLWHEAAVYRFAPAERVAPRVNR